MLVVLLLLVGSVSAQTPMSNVSVTIDGSRARVSLKSSVGSKQWSFLNAYAGALDLGERVQDFSTNAAKVRRLASGEFESESEVSEVNYVVRLDKVRPGDLAHVSWISGEFGFLMLRDLLPDVVLKQPAIRLNLEIPVGWSAATSDVSEREYVVDSPDKRVIFVGRNLRRVEARDKKVQLYLHGDWKFKDKDALRSLEKVFKSYLDLTKFVPARPVKIFVAPIPTPTTSSQWKAETRGSTVVLLVNRDADFSNWIGQLGVIFTHELFHVWIPNSLKLEGDYDWFFEGFTLYVALQTALKLELINFEEYLATLARVYDSYLSYADHQSLLEASAARWTSSNSLVYDKGMLVAFFYDLVLRRETGGAQALKDKYSSLFLTLPGKSIEANKAIIDLLGSTDASRRILKSYVEERRQVELAEVLSPFGIDVVVGSNRSALKVRKNLTPDQSKLLKSLGYRR